jgi:ABC-type branched-subunit amino acid transport system ATPase component
MSIAEMKKLVHEKVDAMEENQLKLIADYIALINKESNVRVSVISHAMEIIKERSVVLDKLAQ